MSELSDKLQKAIDDFRRAKSEADKTLTDLMESHKRESAEYKKKTEEMERRFQEVISSYGPIGIREQGTHLRKEAL